MKSEYEEGKGGAGTNNNSMFGKLHQQKFHQLQQVVARECHHHHQNPPQHTSEEDESRSSGGGGGGGGSGSGSGSGSAINTIMNHNSSEPITTTTTTTGDGATIEVVRRPRGRPPGSKNKAKPPVIITRDTIDSTAMRPYVLEVPGGLDVVDSLVHFTRRRNIGLCVLSGSGTVANVTLRQPSATPGATVTFHGRFDILSISATLLPPSFSSIPSSANSFTISLAGPSGQIVGGSVAGSLLAAGTLYIVAAAFTDPSYHRLPAEDELQSSDSGNVGHSPSGSGGGGGGEGSHSHPAPPAESCGVSIYGCNLSSDVIWAPTARQQQPPPPHF
ncbi:AT-hook motif nuclear-localized protein 17-like [Telopea speciosissima]|uniref:AT-hook motif nuclear-localized protein 17-like n=1 Tax=Telopea speciosissima TaxID=54955 RepID=UPI001CC77AF9|nr:AT-hook motif nuclear-localized protein 17-like [Telopea speciosissima]